MSRLRALLAAGAVFLAMGAARAAGPADPSPAERGAYLARAGDCVACHTAPSGKPFAGGLPMSTPIGTIYSTNITPDRDTGIGGWSFEEFDRLMRRGIRPEGGTVYPAMPYPSYSRLTEADMRALYAYFTQSVEPVRQANRDSDIPWPLSMRWPLAFWRVFFAPSPEPFRPQPGQDPRVARGAYLVEGLGHCSACHTPRNALGAERTGKQRFAGATVDGWQVPPLNGGGKPAIPWTQATLYDYLRNGFSRYHGAAAGPMASVAAGLAQQPDADLQAMARYLATLLPEQPGDFSPEKQAAELEQRTYGTLQPVSGSGGRLFKGACMACHHDGASPKLNGVRPSLAVSNNLYAPTPDNLLRVILDGIGNPARPELGYMPAFRHSLNNAQIIALARYLREDFAGLPAWPDLEFKVAKLR